MTSIDRKDRHTIQKVVSGILMFVLSVMVPIWIENIPNVKFIGGIIVVFILVIYVIVYTLPLGKLIRTDNNVQPNKTNIAKSDNIENIISEIIPDSLTVIRPALGVATAYLLIKGDSIHAFWFYYIGLLSDIFDGMFARALKGTTAWGKRFDAYADSVFNLITGVGILFTSIFITISYYRITVVSLTGLFFLIRKKVIREHTIAAKCFSGLVRVILFSVLWSYLPDSSSMFGLVAGGIFLLVGGSYELMIARQEVRNGIRDMF